MDSDSDDVVMSGSEEEGSDIGELNLPDDLEDLSAGSSAEEDGIESDEEDEMDESAKDVADKAVDDGEKTKDGELTPLTNLIVTSWFAKAEKRPSVKSLSLLVLAFRCGVFSDDDGLDPMAKSDLGDRKKKRKHREGISKRQTLLLSFGYSIEDSDVLDFLLRKCLEKMFVLFDTFLGRTKVNTTSKKKASSSSNAAASAITADKLSPPQSSSHWKSLSSVVKTYVSSCISLLESSSGSDFADWFLFSVGSKIVPYTTPFDNLSRKLAISLMTVWSSAESTRTIMLAYACLRHVCVAQPPARFNDFYKKCLNSYLRSSVNSSVQIFSESTPHDRISVLRDCLVDLSFLSTSTAYYSCFLNLRSMAEITREAYATKTPEVVRRIASWSYVNALRLWIQLFSVFAEEGSKDFTELHHPITQLILSMMAITSSPSYFPFRFHLTSLLIIFASKANLFIPLGAQILEVFQWSRLINPDKHKSKAIILKGGDRVVWSKAIRLQKRQLETVDVQNGVCEIVLRMLVEWMSLYSRSVSFPELERAITSTMRRTMKKAKRFHYNKQFQEIINALTKSSSVCLAKRNDLEKRPSELTSIDVLGISRSEDAVVLLLEKMVKQSEEEDAKRVLGCVSDGGGDMEVDDEEDSDSDSDSEEEEEGEKPKPSPSKPKPKPNPNPKAKSSQKAKRTSTQSARSRKTRVMANDELEKFEISDSD